MSRSTTAAGSVQAPDRSVTVAAARAALAAVDGPGDVDRRLAALRRLGPDPLLDGERTLDLATALLSSGRRLAEAGADSHEVAVVLAGIAGLAGAAHPAAGWDDRELAGPLAAADAVGAWIQQLGADRPVVSEPTVTALSAAVSARLAAGPAGEDELVAVLDLAASLMVLTPGQHSPDLAGTEVLAPLWTAHAALAGWLAAELPAAGYTGLPGGLLHTLSAATGTELGVRP